jgi:hypothetical protein
MNHQLLNQRSEVFVNDSLERVEKRCFFLMCGMQKEDPTIEISVSVNAFDDPAIKKKIQASITLN